MAFYFCKNKNFSRNFNGKDQTVVKLNIRLIRDYNVELKICRTKARSFCNFWWPLVWLNPEIMIIVLRAWSISYKFELFLQVSVAPGGRWSRFKTYSTIQRTLEIWGFVLTFIFRVWLNNQKFSYRGYSLS